MKNITNNIKILWKYLSEWVCKKDRKSVWDAEFTGPFFSPGIDGVAVATCVQTVLYRVFIGASAPENRWYQARTCRAAICPASPWSTQKLTLVMV
ncbi:MAG: hypothetical protein CSA23_06185 [Deltaproteobacteria bacterium]|nr:MAG: hypothetical protein CSA23_06185 [Deltaproteobacteria bacterium]